MGVSLDQMPIDQLLDAMLWTGAIFSLTHGFEEEGKNILEAREKIIAMLGVRHTKRDARVVASVAHVNAWELVRPPLESYERQVDAHFDVDRDGYRKLFPNTIAALMRTPESSRVETFKPMVDFALRPHPGKLGTTAKAFFGAWNEYAGVSEKLRAADDALELASDNVATFRHAGVLLMLEADGLVRARRPGDTAARKKFFHQRVGPKLTLEEEAQRAEERAEKAVTEAKEARARADKAKADAEAKAAAEAAKRAKVEAAKLAKAEKKAKAEAAKRGKRRTRTTSSES